MTSAVLVRAARKSAVLGVLVALSCATGCTAGEVSVADPLPAPPPAVAPDVSSARGQIVEQSSTTGTFADPAGVIGEARRAVYRSVSGVTGGPREVSGVFFTPRGTPPPTGWPVVAFAHGTTGIATDCGPSQDRDLMGFLSVATSYLGDGYAVAMTDYEGLGGAGRHPYLEPRTAAFNVIDAVRALRVLFPDVSHRWAALGNSQGGQAVWSADELAGSYGDGLKLVGTVALSPAANLTALADLVANDSLSSDQRALLPSVVVGLARSMPDALNGLQVSGVTEDNADDVFSCRSPKPPEPGSVRIADIDTFRDALRRIAVPQAPLTAPMMVVNGQADQTIPPEWVAAAVASACRLGGKVDHIEVQGAGHGDLGDDAYRRVSHWIRERFDNRPAPSNCGTAPEVLPAG